MDLKNPKAEWVHRVLLGSAASPAPVLQPDADQGGFDDGDEGPLEQAAQRSQDYVNLLTRIDAELKGLADWRNYLDEEYAGVREIRAFVRNTLPALEGRYTALDNNRRAVATLATQADFPELRRHIAAASTLLADIVTGARTIQQFQTEPQDKLFATRKDVLEKLLAAAPASKQTEVGDIRTRLTGIEDRDVNGVNQLINEASALVEADALRGKLKEALTKLGQEAGKFPTINPVSTSLDGLMDRTAEADSLAPGSVRNLMWSTALADTETVRKAAQAALPVRTEILNTLHTAEVTVQQAPKTTARRDDMLALIKAVRQKIASECASATKFTDVKKKWDPLKAEATDAANQVAAWAKTLINPDKVAQDLKELQDMIGGFGFETFEGKAENKKAAEAIRKLGETDLKSLAGMDAQTLLALDERLVTTLKKVMKLLVDTADPKVLEEEMDKRLAESPEAKTAAQVEFWKAALEKRIGFKVNIPDGVEATKLPQVYELISRLPDSQLMKELVDEFNYDTQAGPCLYSKRKIVMTNMSKDIPEDAAHKLLYPSTDGSAQEKVDYFSMLTLHEIGHAVDDKSKTMPRDAGAVGPGGWKNEAFDDVVAKVAAAMRTGSLSGLPEKDVAAMAREFLMTGKLNKPPSAQAPLGSLLANWDALMVILNKFAGISIAAKTPWEQAVELDGGRCYHEGYPGRWFSYDKRNREASSVSLYQWRAPGEWFAELYAWHYIAKDPRDRATRAAKLPADIKTVIAA